MHERPEFSFDRPFTVSRPGGFVCNGRRYESGDVFDWRAQGLGESEIWDLWVLCQVDNAAAAAAAHSATELGRSGDLVPAPMAPIDSPGDASGADAARRSAMAPTETRCTAAPSPTTVSLPVATAPAAAAPAGQPAPSSQSKPGAAKGVTKPPHQNQLPRR